MNLFAIPEEKIFSDILYDITTSTNLRKVTPGSKIRAIAQALAKKIAKQGKTFDLNIAQSFLDSSAGEYLELIGGMLGVKKLGAEKASVSSINKNVKFYTSTGGTFGSINNENSITIPSGTIVSTGKESTGILFKVPYTVILSSNDTSSYIATESLRAGSSQNVGSEMLNYHNFTNYTDIVNESLLVTNEAEIVNGQEVESDTNFRYRIANQILASEAANETAIRLAVLQVPGVADMVFLPYQRGIGTGDILIKATTPTVSASLIAAIEEVVKKVQSPCNSLLVRGPRETGISIVGVLTLRKKISTTEEANIISTVQSNLTDYINSLDIGEEFIINEAIERVMEALLK